MRRLKVLLITNERIRGDAEGQIDGYKLLVNSGEISSLIVVSHRSTQGKLHAFNEVMDACRYSAYDMVVIWSPVDFPETIDQFESIKREIGHRPILYWEGDPWGDLNQKKAVTSQMGWWMQISELVFSVATTPHFEIFKSYGAKNVQQTIHTYCHKFFGDEERFPPKPIQRDSIDLIMIANNTARIPFVSGSPGSAKRWELAARLVNQRKFRRELFGVGWPPFFSEGNLEYRNQAKIIREAKISINWDNFDKYGAYASDRLSISMIAGRPHVTTLHPEMFWTPSSSQGLLLEKSPRQVLRAALGLLEMSNEEIYRLGLESYKWAKERVSHREAARFVLSTFSTDVTKPPEFPWLQLRSSN